MMTSHLFYSILTVSLKVSYENFWSFSLRKDSWEVLKKYLLFTNSSNIHFVYFLTKLYTSYYHLILLTYMLRKLVVLIKMSCTTIPKWSWILLQCTHIRKRYVSNVERVYTMIYLLHNHQCYTVTDFRNSKMVKQQIICIVHWSIYISFLKKAEVRKSP